MNEKPLKLDMPFAEALERLSKVPYKKPLTTKKQVPKNKNGATEKPRRAGK
jgi:hypothetical protein